MCMLYTVQSAENVIINLSTMNGRVDVLINLRSYNGSTVLEAVLNMNTV